jgi:hypothetical protein
MDYHNLRNKEKQCFSEEEEFLMMILEPLAILAAIIGLSFLEGCLKTWEGISLKKAGKTKQKEMTFGKYGYV